MVLGSVGSIGSIGTAGSAGLSVTAVRVQGSLPLPEERIFSCSSDQVRGNPCSRVLLPVVMVEDVTRYFFQEGLGSGGG